ncbi:ATP-binding protein [Pelagibius marinus]|uniref:ATP-binding protein n=1 Tax=Pelagibius marinus TaxID=2762760 RepID=UPI001873378B|nr:ATP-binding protein [Pelagibius marinus]
MKYKKVFSTTRFTTKAQNNFNADAKRKSIICGARSDESRTVLVGKLIEQGRTSNILDYSVLCDISFPHVIGIFGSRGSGKSFDLGIFLEGIFALQSEQTSDAAIIFDVQDQFWTLAYTPHQGIEEDQGQLDELRRWGLEPRAVQSVSVLVPEASDTQVPGAKPFALASEQLTSSDWLAILELDRYSAMGQALLTLLRSLGPSTPGELARACSDNPALSSFQTSTVDGVRWRLESLEETRIVAASGISIDDVLKPGSLTIILMRNLAESVRGLVVGVMSRLIADRMGRVQQARKVALRTARESELELPDLTRRFWMVLDEAHVLVPSDGTTAATGPLVDYVKRGRDAGLSLIFATQQPSAVNSKLMSQVDLTITHTLGFDADLSAAVARMPTRTSVEYEIANQKVSALGDIIRNLGPGEAIVADSASGRAFIAKMRPRVSAHGGATPK